MANALKTIFIFTGQGSQYRGMGKKLYEQNEVFRDSLLASEVVFQQNLGRSLIKELYSKKNESFDELIITHPAIVAVEIALLRVLQAMGVVPDLVFGNSLGEFAAAVAAGILGTAKE